MNCVTLVWSKETTTGQTDDKSSWECLLSSAVLEKVHLYLNLQCRPFVRPVAITVLRPKLYTFSSLPFLQKTYWCMQYVWIWDIRLHHTSCLELWSSCSHFLQSVYYYIDYTYKSQRSSTHLNVLSSVYAVTVAESMWRIFRCAEDYKSEPLTVK